MVVGPGSVRHRVPKGCLADIGGEEKESHREFWG